MQRTCTPLEKYFLLVLKIVISEGSFYIKEKYHSIVFDVCKLNSGYYYSYFIKENVHTTFVQCRLSSRKLNI